MAVNTTSALYAGFIFDGVNSRDMGVYVQDVQVFGAPERDVEMVSIPGRDGEYALDRGRFSNIEVTYTCALGAGAPEDFNEAISALRNWLASRVGYKRLEDEINTDEYRRAVFKDGLDVETINKQTGTFEVTFSCMPQRWLKSGETSQAVTSGGTIENPTLFSARPLLEVYGYGAIDIDGETVSINSEPLGDVNVLNMQHGNGSDVVTSGSPAAFFLAARAVNAAQLNTGDAISLDYAVDVSMAPASSVYTAAETNITKISGGLSAGSSHVKSGRAVFSVSGSSMWGSGISLVKGTAAEVSGTYQCSFNDSGAQDIYTAQLSIIIRYDGSDGFSITTGVRAIAIPAAGLSCSASYNLGGARGISTKSALGEPAYIDLDIGEAYKIEGGAIVGINNGVTLPGDLPELAPGENTITFDSTITGVNIVPRWWKV